MHQMVLNIGPTTALITGMIPPCQQSCLVWLFNRSLRMSGVMHMHSYDCGVTSIVFARARWLVQSIGPDAVACSTLRAS